MASLFFKNNDHDLLYAAMEMCVKATSGFPSEKIIQSVQAAPEPLSILALEQQLLDLDRFCICDVMGSFYFLDTKGWGGCRK